MARNVLGNKLLRGFDYIHTEKIKRKKTQKYKTFKMKEEDEEVIHKVRKTRPATYFC